MGLTEPQLIAGLFVLLVIAAALAMPAPIRTRAVLRARRVGR